MTHLRFAATSTIVALMVSAAALAKDEWKTVSLDGNPDLTISIPVAVNDYAGGKDADDLMFFSVTAGSHGSLACFANRADYPKNVAQASFAAALSTVRRESFCGRDGATVTNLQISHSESFDHNGLQAAVCTASYTDSSQRNPGWVQSQMVIAAPHKAYFVTCTVEDEDQEQAQYEWAAFWGERVRHIQRSFHLPK